KKPQYVLKQDISEEQAIVYRLSGDYNSLHIADYLSLLKPPISISAGFGGPILHRLSTLGFVAHGILAAVGANDVNALKGFGCRFTRPLKLGDQIETCVWEVGPGPNGTTELAFITKNLTSGMVIYG
ncbi:hypothetical protein M422DRAFT_96150, partial [Sphaerobolus stellatus SS14]